MRWLCTVVLVAGCGCPEPLDECLDYAPPMQGLYGRVLVGQDVRTGECATWPAPPLMGTVTIRSLETGGERELETDAEGIYAADLAPGTYSVCLVEAPSQRGACTDPVLVMDGHRVRVDFRTSVFSAFSLVGVAARCNA